MFFFVVLALGSIPNYLHLHCKMKIPGKLHGYDYLSSAVVARPIDLLWSFLRLHLTYTHTPHLYIYQQRQYMAVHSSPMQKCA